MQDLECPYKSECGTTKPFRSEKKYNVHLALIHESYKSGEAVSQATIRSLELVKDRALFLMLKFPECRRTDNGDLYLKYLQYWTRTINYDTSTQDYVMNDEEAPRDHIKHRKLRWGLAQLETLRRDREKLQAKERGKKKAGLPYLDILPSEADQALADAREETVRHEMIQDQAGRMQEADYTK